MKLNDRKKTLTLGELIACVYETCGQRKARGIVLLAMEANLIEFRREQLLSSPETLNPEATM